MTDNTIPVFVDEGHLMALTIEYVEGKLAAAGKGHLRVIPESFALMDNGVHIALEERPPETPKVRSLDDLLGQAPAPTPVVPPASGPAPVRQADPSDAIAAAVAASMQTPLEEPPPLVAAGETKLYGAPPQLSPEERAAFEALKQAGVVPAHMTPELMASQHRDDVRLGVGEVLDSGYVVGTTPPAGHPDDPHKHKPWRRSGYNIANVVAGALRQETA